ncbi:methyltransferase [Aliarcobacter butzleri 7h1h]|uniref:class I SAM-dependent methyltransferase n=1 Tax=Aliarcobacter butzleri TaxID=28197 RepID=UPI0002F8866C|nr:methyltransferase domain-containing protein [Aliarcobacter butzleri]AGR76973.1 methyltransferase [Aliarcobacter butzleri 7h1h]
MKQTEKENNMLEDLFEKKSSIAYDNSYISSSVVTTKPQLGTIEEDASGKYGRWSKEDFRAKKLAELSIKKVKFESVLGIGAGNLLASSYFTKHGKIVDVCDFSTSPYFSDELIITSGIRNFIDGDFNLLDINTKYDFIWASHVLEHQLNPSDFLNKIVKLVKDDGYLAITVPPRKPFIVSGHINLFNPGLLVYRIILAGIDCSDAKVFQYDGNICILVQAKKFSLPKLTYDIGDIELLSKYFPFKVTEGFNGDFMHVNLSNDEKELIYQNQSNLL